MRQPQQAVLTLPPHVRSAADARRFVKNTLGAWRCQDLVEVAELLVSELVSNAVRHAGTAVRVTVTRQREQILVEVTDGSAAPPRPRLAEPYSEEGRGLFLVDRLARDWGVRRERRGKSVWFLLDPFSQIVPVG